MSEFLRFQFTQPPPGPSGADRWSVGASRWANSMRPLVRNALKEKAPVSKSGSGGKPGQFRASITQRTTKRSGSLLIEFGSPAAYTPYIVDGTRPHTIVPRSARVLHFRTAGGDEVFTRRVNHPGTRPNDFVRRAVLPLLPEIQESFTLIMREVFGGTS